jgi:metallo-beta-lactamase class B
LIKCIEYIALYLFLTVYVSGQVHSAVNLSKIEDSVWVHTTYKLYDNFNMPSNGLIIQTTAGLVLIDTPWDDSLTVELLDSVKNRFNQDVVFAIVTHAHADRMGGISTLHKKGIKVVSYILTCQKAKEQGFEVPEHVSVIDTTFVIGYENLELFYPGAGHTIDNSVVWLPKRKILFGGCLVKSKESTNLGNIAEADLKEWPRSLHALMRKFSTVQVVVPGHGTSGNSNLLLHTIDLLKKK